MYFPVCLQLGVEKPWERVSISLGSGAVALDEE